MKFHSKALPTILLFILSESFAGVKCLESIFPDVTYEDINRLNATCKGADSCHFTRPGDEPEDYNCNCGSFCSYFGTCCVDSPYVRNSPKMPVNARCEHYYDTRVSRYYSHLMISSCDPDLEGDKTTVELCNSNGEESNDPFLKIPVTDPVTGISYKNYYCHACNEQFTSENPIPWKLEVKSYDEVNRSSIENLRYDSKGSSWVKDNGEAVLLNTYVPEELKRVVFQQHCDTSNIVWHCASDWTDYGNIRNKCVSYMALARIPAPGGHSMDQYRNPHCAICNHRNIQNMVCDGAKAFHDVSYGFRGFVVGLFKILSSECEDGMIYDDFAKKCRRVFRMKRKVH